MAEFLPLCDVLFNVISLAGYFCDVVFDVVLGYALFERGRTTYFTIVICLVGLSLVVSQVVSLRWYLNKSKIRCNSLTVINDNNTNNLNEHKKHLKLKKNQNKMLINKQSDVTTSKIGRYAVIALHCTQLGVLWRYAKLFVPVDLRHVKHEVRDLCMLRLVHAFCEAAPMLLLQLHVLVTIQNEQAAGLIESKLKSLGGNNMMTTVGHISPSIVQQTAITQQQQRTFKDLNIVSAVLSLFSVCWALASFSKNVRLQNVHRLVLTWLGVIFQFLWRLGTVISRVTSLTVYASLYSHWVFLVIILHWTSMFLWLISPKNVFHGERISRLRKATLTAMIAFVYVFAYINLQEVNHRQKMFIFYLVMFLENCLLVCLWIFGIWADKPDGWFLIPVLVICSFLIGIVFLLLYYRYFHVRRLGYEAGGRLPDGNKKCFQCISADGPNCITNESGTVTNSGDITGYNGCSSVRVSNLGGRFGGKYHHHHHAIPGVFNCRFSNPVIGNCATKRKKKKPTTFVPPPTLGLASLNESISGGTETVSVGGSASGHMAIAFWRRPLPRSHTGGSSENEGSVGSRVNIHQKLQEKKQKQLAELKIIEEEIKQGKLGGPVAATLEIGDDGKASLPRQPIPRVKKHIDLEPAEWRTPSPHLNDLNVLSASNLDDVNNLNKFSTSNYDSIYSTFGLNGINIPALSKYANDTAIDPSNRNMSPISSQISATESNSLTRQVMSRPKIPRNPFAENYRVGNFVNMYADAASGGVGNGNNGGVITGQNNVINNVGNGNNGQNNVQRPPSISPRNTTNSPNRNGMYDHHSGGLYLEVNHPRQISATYSSGVENSGVVDNSFTSYPPYNVMLPPRSKMDNRATPTINCSLQQQQHQQNNLNSASGMLIGKLTQRQIQRAKTPEILLSPHYLENSRIYYDWVTREPIYRHQDGDKNQTMSSGDENLDNSAADESVLGSGQIGQRIPSDIDSQISLPRSYTLPREFKYYRRYKARKLIKNEHFIASTNSSDGDVDSCDDNEAAHSSNITNSNSRFNQQTSRHIGVNSIVDNMQQQQQQQNYHHNHNILINDQQHNNNVHNYTNLSGRISVTTVQNPSGTTNISKTVPPMVNSSMLLPNNVVQQVVSVGQQIRASPIAAVLHNYSNINTNTGGVSASIQQTIIDGSSSGSTSGGGGGNGASNLDLINGVDTGNILNRQMRLRVYGGVKGGMVRHETKL